MRSPATAGLCGRILRKNRVEHGCGYDAFAGLLQKAAPVAGGRPILLQCFEEGFMMVAHAKIFTGAGIKMVPVGCLFLPLWMDFIHLTFILAQG